MGGRYPHPTSSEVKQLELNLTIWFLRVWSRISISRMSSRLNGYISFSYPKTLPLQYKKSQATNIFTLDKNKYSIRTEKRIVQ